MAFVTYWRIKPRQTLSARGHCQSSRLVKLFYKTTLCASLRLPSKSLIFITPNGCCQHLEQLEKTCMEAMIGGVSAIQLRDLYSNDTDFYKAARRLVKVVDHNCLFIINRNVKLALEVGASGVHFAESQLNDRSVKDIAILSQLLVGISVHSVSSARSAMEWSPSYIQVGSIFATPSHPEQEPLGLVRLKEIQKGIPSSIPLVAVGGIQLENVHMIRNEGIDNVAVISAIANSSNRIEYCRNLKKQLE